MNLFEALKSAENALEIYAKRKESADSGKNNIYGQALQEFQLGYLYEKYAKEFINPNTRYYAKSNDYAKSRLLEEEKQAYDKAIEHFSAACALFK